MQANTGGAPNDDEQVLGPSDRSFGLTLGTICVLIGLVPLWRGGQPRAWALIACAVLWAAAIAAPRTLGPANRVWLRIGLAMHRVMHPVVMAVLFYGVVTPFGLAMRLIRRPPVRLGPDPSASTYWIARDTAIGRMDQQF